MRNVIIILNLRNNRSGIFKTRRKHFVEQFREFTEQKGKWRES